MRKSFIGANWKFSSFPCYQLVPLRLSGSPKWLSRASSVWFPDKKPIWPVGCSRIKILDFKVTFSKVKMFFWLWTWLQVAVQDRDNFENWAIVLAKTFSVLWDRQYGFHFLDLAFSFSAQFDRLAWLMDCILFGLASRSWTWQVRRIFAWQLSNGNSLLSKPLTFHMWNMRNNTICKFYKLLRTNALQHYCLCLRAKLLFSKVKLYSRLYPRLYSRV